MAELAKEHADDLALRFVHRGAPETTVTWSELDLRTNQIARLMAGRGAQSDRRVVVGLRNTPEHFLATIAAWKLGACVLVLDPSLPERERDSLLDLAAPTLVIASWDDTTCPLLRPEQLDDAGALSQSPLPEIDPLPAKAIASSATTGHPKLIVDVRPWAGEPGGAVRRIWGYSQVGPGRTQLIVGPLYSGTYFTNAYWGLFHGAQLVVMPRFDADWVLDLVEETRVNFMTMVPAMMLRIARLPNACRRDLSSLDAISHTGATCPDWVKRWWLERLGPERIWEIYGSTEAVGVAAIRGDEWVAHPGSVGRPVDARIRILSDAGEELPAGSIGLIYMQPLHTGAEHASPFRYVGAPPPPSLPEGFVHLGDLGRLDSEGYLYITDRRLDMIVTGGFNVYPREVEDVIMGLPAVQDVAVIGLPDTEWGQRVHALVEVAPGQPTPTMEELDAACRRALAAHKVPKSYEIVPSLPRMENGKIRRSALRDARLDLFRPVASGATPHTAQGGWKHPPTKGNPTHPYSWPPEGYPEGKNAPAVQQPNPRTTRRTSPQQRMSTRD